MSTTKFFGRYQAYTKVDGKFIQGGATGHNAASAKEALAEAWKEANDAASRYGGTAIVYDNHARHGEGKPLLNNPQHTMPATTTTQKETAPKSARQLTNGEVQRTGNATLEGRPGCYTATVFACTDERHQSHSFSTLKPARAKFAQLASL